MATQPAVIYMDSGSWWKRNAATASCPTMAMIGNSGNSGIT
jgi:hypothetical protein